MIVRHLPVQSVNWGNGTSDRYITEKDGLGYGLNFTVVYAGTSSHLQYLNHAESVFITSGWGFLTEKNGTRHPLAPGTMYSLNDHDAHTLTANPDNDLEVVCVFTPALRGDEVHHLTDDGYSGF